MRRIALLALLTIAIPVVVPAEEVYRRATVLDDRVGRVEIRSAYGVRLTVLVDCESEPRGCSEEEVYAEVLKLDFILEHRKALQDEVVRSEEPAGTVSIALSLSQDGLNAFRDRLFDLLRGMSAQAFTEPFAGLTYEKLPLDDAPPSAAEKPLWACFESGDRTRVARLARDVEDSAEGTRVVGRRSASHRGARHQRLAARVADPDGRPPARPASSNRAGRRNGLTCRLSAHDAARRDRGSRGRLGRHQSGVSGTECTGGSRGAARRDRPGRLPRSHRRAAGSIRGTTAGADRGDRRHAGSGSGIGGLDRGAVP